MTKAIIATIAGAGYVVRVADGTAQPVVETIDRASGERFVVRGDDLYATVAELAVQVGIDLED